METQGQFGRVGARASYDIFVRDEVNRTDSAVNVFLSYYKPLTLKYLPRHRSHTPHPAHTHTHMQLSYIG